MLNCKIRLLNNKLISAKYGSVLSFSDGVLIYPDGTYGCRYPTLEEFKFCNQGVEYEVIEWEGKPVKIEDHPAFKDDAQKLPRICYILGGEKTPLGIKEIFEIESKKAFVDESGTVWISGAEYCLGGFVLCDMINHPEKIIRRPQFSEDEKALMRLLVKNNLPWIARDDGSESLFVYEKAPEKCGSCFSNEDCTYEAVPDALFPQITFENSPFDAAAYLESEANHE